MFRMKLIRLGTLGLWMMCLMLLFQPVGFAFASEDSGDVAQNLSQEINTESNTDAQDKSQPETYQDDSSQANNDEQTAEPVGDFVDEESQHQELSEPENDPQPLSLPVSQSSIKQKIPETDLATGALTFNYAIPQPAGRKNLSPNLSLQYNSQNIEASIWTGYGWSLDIPFIERKNLNGTNRLYEAKDFSSSLDGDLRLVATDDFEVYAPKIENGSLNNYLRDGANWVVKSKNGIQYIFGHHTEHRISNPTNDNQIYRWYLSKIEDSNGNYISYHYDKEAGMVYPTSIEYTAHRDVGSSYKLAVRYQDRPDQYSSAKYGYLLKTTKRLQSVETLFNDIIFSRVEIDYADDVLGDKSLISEIETLTWSEHAQQVTSGKTRFSYNSPGASHLITQVVQPTGGRIDIEYLPSTQYKTASGELQNPNLPFAVFTVKNLRYDDQHGTVWQNNFDYSGGWYYFNSPMDRRFAGFEKVTRTDDVGNQTISYYHQGNGSNELFGEVEDDWAKQGKLYKMQITDNEGRLFSEVLNNYGYERQEGDGGLRSKVYLQQSVRRDFDGNSSHKDLAVTYSYDEFGNVVSQIDWGEVSANELGEFVDIGTDKVLTTYAYAQPIGDTQILNAIISTIVKNQQLQKVTENKFYYDELGFGLVDSGNQTTEEVWMSENTYASKFKIYNSLGLVAREFDANGNLTMYEYDEFGLYPTLVTNAARQTTSYEYNYFIGQPKLVINPNGLRQEIIYDGLGRLLEKKQSLPQSNDPGDLYTTHSYEYNFWENGGEVVGQQIVEKIWQGKFENNPIIRHNLTYSDGFGRMIQTRQQVEANSERDPERFVVQDTIYNSLGQVAKLSLPYFGFESGYTDSNTNQALWTQFFYDALYRKIREQNIAGQTLWEHNDWSELITDPLGHQKRLVKNSKEQLLSVEEIMSDGVLRTEYQYDAVGNLIKVTDALSNERNFLYDGRGLRIVAEDLHASHDAEFGVWQYEYDLNGNLIATVSPNGDRVIQSYDALNRLILRGLDKQPADYIYHYDDCENGVGYLCSVTYGQTTTNYDYDILGKVIGEQQIIQDLAYLTQYEYDRQGNTVKIIYPDLLEVHYTIGISGREIAVYQKRQGSLEDTAVIDRISYHAGGGISRIEYATGSWVENLYDENQLYRLLQKKIVINESGTEVVAHDMYYNYDAVGNIVLIDDQSELSPKTASFDYDELYRLTSSTIIKDLIVDTQLLEYDAIGNIIYNSDVGFYFYEGDVDSGNYANPHAVTMVKSSTEGNRFLEYDRNGNLVTYDRLWRYEWTYDNLLARVSGGVNQPVDERYWYDYSNSKVLELSAAQTRHIPNQYYNQVLGGVSTSHILASSTLIATITSELLGGYDQRDLFTDHLGSIILSTNPRGQILEQVSYQAFGGIHHQSLAEGQNPEQRKFTGHEYDIDTGLNYAGARYYNSSIGRFVSQDPVFWNMSEIETQLADPQSWNSYSYARNNPLILTDPTGEFWHIVAGAAVGAAISGGITYWRTGDWGQAGKAAAGGAVAGALFAAVGPASLAGTVATGAVSSAAGNTLTRSLNGEQITAGTVATDAAAGAVGGALGYGATKATQAVASNLAGPSLPKADSFKYINTAERIVDDHALDKHIMANNSSFGNIISNESRAVAREQSIGYVNSVMNGPNSIFRTPRGNIIYDKRLGGVIFDTKTRPSFFQPRGFPTGKSYFLDAVKRSINQNLKK